MSRRALLARTTRHKVLFRLGPLQSLRVTEIYRPLKRRQSRNMMQLDQMKMQLLMNDSELLKTFLPIGTEILRPTTARRLAARIIIFHAVERRVICLSLRAPQVYFLFIIFISSQTWQTFVWKAYTFSLSCPEKFPVFCNALAYKKLFILQLLKYLKEIYRSKYTPTLFLKKSSHREGLRFLLWKLF